MAYRLTLMRARGTERVADIAFASKAVAFLAFQRMAAEHILEWDTCILLSRDTGRAGCGTTLAAKSTDARHVEVHQAFYQVD